MTTSFDLKESQIADNKKQTKSLKNGHLKVNSKKRVTQNKEGKDPLTRSH